MNTGKVQVRWLLTLLSFVGGRWHSDKYGSATGRAEAFAPAVVHRHGCSRTSWISCSPSSLKATIAPTADETSSSSLSDLVLATMGSLRDESNEYAEMFELTEAEAAFYALFSAIRKTPVTLGLKGEPFVLRQAEIEEALGQETAWRDFFTMNDLEKALEDDFLDAARGSTDNRKGWKITDVAQPRGESFEEARMTYSDVLAALEKGTVIFNAAGAHMAKLAGPSLATTDATALPCALNLYVTDPGKRTSAPPHTDKQDVVVAQSTGRKHWRVYTPPDPSIKPGADAFARGKGDDSLPLYALESDLGCKLLIETTLNPGDILFIPAGFPHTTSTVTEDDAGSEEKTSIHLTLGIDHHIWELDYLSVRRLALRRACVGDTALGQQSEQDSPFVGKVNQLPVSVNADLMAELPLGLLEEAGMSTEDPDVVINDVVAEMELICKEVDPTTADALSTELIKETVERIRQQGMELFETHRDMYLAALEEGRARAAEETMTAHLGEAKRVMTPERMQRLSLFRVKRFFDQINASKQALKEWSLAGTPATTESGATAGAPATGGLPRNWAFTAPVKVGDQVEADLGGAFFPATVTKVSSAGYDVQFFDGDSEVGLDRSQVKLQSPPATPTSTADVDTSNMTPKQLKRWKKQQEKLIK